MRVHCLICIAGLSALLGTPAHAFDAAFNLSVNPEGGGSSVIGDVNIRWDRNLSSILNFSSSASGGISFDVPGFGDAIQNRTSDKLQLDFLPISYGLRLGGFALGLSAGMSYVKIGELTSAIMNDKDGILLDPPGQYISYSNSRSATLLSPRVGLSASSPIMTLARFSYAGFVSPIYYMTLQQTAEYDFLAGPSRNELKRWSSPYFEQRISLDFMNLFRGVLEHSFQRLDFQTMDWAPDGMSLVGVDDVQSVQELRVGFELLLPIRAGTVRFKGGVYWLTSHVDSSHWGTRGSDRKIELRFGVEG